LFFISPLLIALSLVVLLLIKLTWAFIYPVTCVWLLFPSFWQYWRGYMQWSIYFLSACWSDLLLCVFCYFCVFFNCCKIVYVTAVAFRVQVLAITMHPVSIELTLKFKSV